MKYLKFISQFSNFIKRVDGRKFRYLEDFLVYIREHVKYFLSNYHVEPLNREIIEKFDKLISEEYRTNETLHQAYDLTSNFNEDTSKTSIFIYLLWLSVEKCLTIKGIYRKTSRDSLLKHNGEFLVQLYRSKNDFQRLNFCLQTYIEDIQKIQHKLSSKEVLETIRWTIGAVEIFIANKELNFKGYQWLIKLDEKIEKSMSFMMNIESIIEEVFELFKESPKLITVDCIYVEYLLIFVRNTFMKMIKMKETLLAEIMEVYSGKQKMPSKELIVNLNKLTFRAISIFSKDSETRDLLKRCREIMFDSDGNVDQMENLHKLLANFPSLNRDIVYYTGFLWSKASTILEEELNYQITPFDAMKRKLFGLYNCIEMNRLHSNGEAFETNAILEFHDINRSEIEVLTLEESLKIIKWSLIHMSSMGKFEKSWIGDIDSFIRLIETDPEVSDESKVEILERFINFSTKNEIINEIIMTLRKISKKFTSVHPMVHPQKEFNSPRELIKSIHCLTLIKWDQLDEIEIKGLIDEFHQKINMNTSVLQLSDHEKLEFERFTRKFEIFTANHWNIEYLFDSVNLLSSFIEYSKYFYIFTGILYCFIFNLLMLRKDNLIVDDYYVELEGIAKKSIYLYLEDLSEHVEVVFVDDIVNCYNAIIVKRNNRMVMKYSKCFMNSIFWLLRRMTDRERRWIEKANAFVEVCQTENSKMIKNTFKGICDVKPGGTMFYRTLNFIQKWLNLLS